ncbi:ATP-dependent helicase [Enterobacteriaceae bacterium EKM102V]|uniref:UvrD-helicase domain-containing protein n=1 Tax=Pantoea TaxID=53335 RepID=UPI00142E49DE|nr:MULTISPECIES: ATP-dependent helicase [Pantoea]KAF6661306.1 ATP-dependent helicase [Enterobacteriaceae bacterium EKM102V]KAF6668185.1 ATP-dependent helicase [Pantoea sp. EKM103V]
MMYVESQDVLIEEVKVFDTLLGYVNDKKSFYFLSGAGSGKTHALISLIKKIMHDKKSQLALSRQKILCITYTNNAKDEIISRLGENDLVYVSTIHNFLWDMIQHHMDALVVIHVTYLTDLIKKNENELFYDENDKPAYQVYRGLNQAELEAVTDFILEDNESYYKMQELNAGDFWQLLNDELGQDLSNKLKTNKSHLLKIFSCIRRIYNYKNCVKNIAEGVRGYDFIEYSIRNAECLYKNRIGHDTLLLYSYKLMKNYPYFANILIDKFPYTFVDEYQDTHDNVVAFFKLIIERLKPGGSQYLIGLFGDPSQEIYSSGARTSFLTFDEVHKNINRRSHDQIIDCINKIRGGHQPIKQVSIFRNKNLGSVKCYIYPMSKCNKSDIEKIIDSYRAEWDVSLSNQMACLVSKNEMLAEVCNFSNLYSKVNDLFVAENKNNYKKVNDEFVVNNIDKFGSFASIMYSYCKPAYLLKIKSDAPIIELFPKLHLQECTVKDIGMAVRKLNALSYCSLEEYFVNLYELFNTTKNKRVKSLINSLLPIEFDSEDIWKEKLVRYCGLRKVKFDDAVFQNFLKVDFDEMIHWMKYINSNKTDSPVNVMTCHSSKGLEYENVIVFLNDKMNKRHTYFSSLLNSDLNVELSPDLEEVRRLLYVSTSRAIKNLRVVLFSDNGLEKDSIQKIFNNYEFFS